MTQLYLPFSFFNNANARELAWAPLQLPDVLHVWPTVFIA